MAARAPIASHGNAAARRGRRADRRRARRRRQRLEVEREVARGLEAQVRVLLEAVAHDPLERRRDVLVRDGEIRRVLLEDRRHRVGRRSRRGTPACPRASRRGSRRRRRCRCARRRACRAPARATCSRACPARRRARCRAVSVGRLVRGGGRALGLRQLRQAEVEDLDAAVGGDEEVLGLQVAVDDPLVVRRGEALRDLERVVDRPCAARSGPPASVARSVSPSSSSWTT